MRASSITGCSTPQILTQSRGFLQYGQRANQKKWAVVAGSGGLSALSLNRRNNKGRKTKTESKPQTEKPMQTKQSVTNSNNHQLRLLAEKSMQR